MVAPFQSPLSPRRNALRSIAAMALRISGGSWTRSLAFNPARRRSVILTSRSTMPKRLATTLYALRISALCSRAREERDLSLSSIFWLLASGLASATHCAGDAGASFVVCFSSVFRLCAFHFEFAAMVAFCERFWRSMSAFSARVFVSIPSPSMIFPCSTSASRMRTKPALGAPQRRASRPSSRGIGPSCSNIRHSRVM